MDFINNYYWEIIAFIGGFAIGALMMRAWRKWREPFEQRWAWDSHTKAWIENDKLKKDLNNLEYERNTYRSEVKQLKDLPEIAERLEALAKIDAQIKERQEESNKLRKENGRLKSEKLIEEQKQAEEEAKAKKRAKREQAKEADDSLSEYEEESENIGTKPPKM